MNGEEHDGFGGLGDVPEDRNFFWRTQFKELLQKHAAEEPISVQLLKLAEVFIMAPQNVVPAFAKPFKVTTPPDGVILPPSPGPLTFYSTLCYKVPPQNGAVVTCINQELESHGAYNDVGIRLFYRGQSPPDWHPQKPETNPQIIVLFHEEEICVQHENLSGLIAHTAYGEIIGYTFSVYQHDKSQWGLRVRTK
jgi:hypothetical protein